MHTRASSFESFTELSEKSMEKKEKFLERLKSCDNEIHE